MNNLKHWHVGFAFENFCSMPPRCNIAIGIKKNKMKVQIDNSVLCLRFGV